LTKYKIQTFDLSKPSEISYLINKPLILFNIISSPYYSKTFGLGHKA